MTTATMAIGTATHIAFDRSGVAAGVAVTGVTGLPGGVTGVTGGVAAGVTERVRGVGGGASGGIAGAAGTGTRASAPQVEQNCAPGGSAAPQFEQKRIGDAPRQKACRCATLRLPMKRILIAAALVILQFGCATTGDHEIEMRSHSERYVKLVLAMGHHDADYVDAYYGPKEWKEEVDAKRPSLLEIHANATALRGEIAQLTRPDEPTLALRHEYLRRQLDALIARADMLRGKKLSFDEESKALYDAVAPTHPEQYFIDLNAQIARELPGEGSLLDRIEAFRKEFVIPREKLDTVFKAAIEACRERTLQHFKLPEGESFTVEYVTGKSWSGYNWYQGGYRSLIQVNTDLPIYVDRAIDLACHEGYPGHHVYNVLLEQHLVNERGWKEFTVYPLFSPQSLIAEGSANYGIDVAFPANERVEYEKKTLFPLAGLDPSRAEKYYRVQELTAKTGYAGNEAARRYLNGEINAEQAAEWLTKYALMAPARAQQRVKFIDQYRSYVINYNLGKDLVRDYVERRSNGNDATRWKVFEELLSSPRLPSGLR